MHQSCFQGFFYCVSEQAVSPNENHSIVVSVTKIETCFNLCIYFFDIIPLFSRN